MTSIARFEACARSSCATLHPRRTTSPSRSPRSNGAFSIARNPHETSRQSLSTSRRATERSRLTSTRSSARSRDTARERVFAAAAQAFRVSVDALDLDSGPTITAGWDALGHFAFVAKLERAFDVRITTRDILAIRRLGDAVALLERSDDPDGNRGAPLATR